MTSKQAFLYRGAVYCRECILPVCSDLAARGYFTIQSERPELMYDDEVFPQRIEDGTPCHRHG